MIECDSSKLTSCEIYMCMYVRESISKCAAPRIEYMCSHAKQPSATSKHVRFTQ